MKKFIVIFVAWCVFSMSIGIYREYCTTKETDVKVESIDHTDMDDLNNQVSTEFDKYIRFDDMDRTESGDYYVETGKYSSRHYDKEYVDYQKSIGIEGDMVTINQSLYDVNK